MTEKERNELIQGIVGLKESLHSFEHDNKLKVLKEIKQKHYSIVDKIDSLKKGTVEYETILLSLNTYIDSIVGNLLEAYPLLKALDKECLAEVDFSYAEFMLTWTLDLFSAILLTFDSDLSAEKKEEIIQTIKDVKNLNKGE